MSYIDYLNTNRFPHKMCAGCGHGLSMGAVARALEELNIDPHNLVAVSGIGCWARLDGYLSCNSFHGTHGRALAFATGIKVANPELTVIAACGDGDGATIGGNHLIHAARRNIDITVIMANNYNYGTTGGQYSSTTPEGSITATSVYGHIERGLDVCSLVAAAGATYVARTTCDNVLQAKKFIVEGVRHKGFSFIEILSPCPTHYGKNNAFKRPSDMIKGLQKVVYPVAKADSLSAEEKRGKLAVGKLVEINDELDYSTKYEKLRALAQKEAEA